MNFREVFEHAAANQKVDEDDLEISSSAESLARFGENTIWQDIQKTIKARVEALKSELAELGRDVDEESGREFVPTTADYAFIQGEIFAWKVILDLPENMARNLAADYKENQDG